MKSLVALLACALFAGAASYLTVPEADACCPAPPSGKAVVNADQTVIIVWDAANKTQHFIRRASFASAAEDFGFLVPTPSQPDLQESGDGAFPLLAKVTEPEVIKMPRPAEESGCSACGSASKSSRMAVTPVTAVTVLEEKTVAGFDAVVLEATSADALVGWLKDKGYAFSPEVEAWAKPYVEGGWKITALRVSKEKGADASATRVAAGALRLSFKTDRPLFPYREPDSSASAAALGASQRLLRIYFIGDERFEGAIAPDHPWTGKVAWAGPIDGASQARLLEELRLGPDSTLGKGYLTEFEDPWPYRKAPADLYFAASATQAPVKREPIIEYTSLPPSRDVNIGLALLLPLAWRLRRRTRPPTPDPRGTW